MKLLYIQDLLEFGGINRISSIKQNYLCNKGFTIYNLCMADEHGAVSDYKYDERIQFNSLYAEKYRRLHKIPLIGRIVRFIVFRFDFIKKIYSINPDIIITTRDYIEPLTVILFSFWKKRILEFHGSLIPSQIEESTLKEKLRWRFKYPFYNKVTLTNKDKEYREKWCGGKYIVINNPNYLKTDNIATLDNKVVISLGRYNDQKGYDLLIPAWKRIANLYPQWHLNIYGKGDDFNNLENLIITNNLDKSISLLPPQSNVVPLLLDSSIYVMSSRYEGFPLVLPEAMKCGLPCVSFDCPAGPSEIIKNNEDGFVVEYLNTDKLIDKIIYLINNERERKEFGKRASQNIERFNIENIMSKWIQLFNQLKRK